VGRREAPATVKEPTDGMSFALPVGEIMPGAGISSSLGTSLKGSTIVMRRFLGSFASASRRGSRSASPRTSRMRAAATPLASSTRRAALARSADSSQLE
jgi:hypothetical protein